MLHPETFTNKTNEVLASAHEMAMSAGHAFFAPLHIAVALISDPNGIFRNAVGNSADRAFNHALNKLPSHSLPSPAPHEVPATSSTLETINLARCNNRGILVGVDDLFSAVLEDSQVRDLLKQSGISTSQVMAKIENLRAKQGKNTITSHKSRALKTFGCDLVEQAGKLDPVIGRDKEITKVIRILSRRTKKNPLLIGEPGVGKTAIVKGLAQRIMRGGVPSNFDDVRLVAFDMQAFKFEERLKAVLKDVEDVKVKVKVILFIDKIHLVLGAAPIVDVAKLLSPVLAKGQLRCIGTTTLEEYHKYLEKDATFERHFQQVMVAEPSVPDTISILRGLKERYARHHGVRILDPALMLAAQLSNRHITGFLPDKAIDIVDEACANVRVQLDSPEEISNLETKKMQLEFELDAIGKNRGNIRNPHYVKVKKELENLRDELEPLTIRYKMEQERIDEICRLKLKKEQLFVEMREYHMKYNMLRCTELGFRMIPEVEDAIKRLEGTNVMLTETVGVDQIVEVVSRRTGIPVTWLRTNGKERLIALADRLRERVVGQDQAIDAVVDALLRSRAGFGKQTNLFLFLGPTGVGKTELAKALAEQLYDDEKLMFRIDMSGYTEQHSVAGYVGKLTEAARTRPHSVVLFDEVEKAHESAFSSLLQMLDDGTVDFTNIVIIMASNLGAEYLLKGLSGKTTMDNARAMVMQEARRHFKPELVNRLDEILIFEPLSHEQSRKVTRLELKDVAIRLAERGIALGVSEAAIDVILNESYDPVCGAWSIKRWLERRVVTKVSKMLIEENIDYTSTIYIDADMNREELSYRTERNAVVNCAPRHQYEILIQLTANATGAAEAVNRIKWANVGC